MELFVDFDRLFEVEEDPEIDNEKQTVLQENLSDSEDELEATYDVDDEDEDDEEGRAIVALQDSSKQPMNEGFAELENMAVAAPEDGEFMVGIEYSSRKAVISAIRTYHINRGVDYAVYESEPQTFFLPSARVLEKVVIG
ncbi:hypothetical protein PIB30_027322 [Stylosanthes scabra]|uniref:Uncharacterized protein n=1 Tax=Stylosanthes scabra TaxID=79078 RepID=A0ABU6QAT3_9FABA|nr:hypothetical protein [Stylosanthes scabra]